MTQIKYNYKDNQYNNIYDLSEALGKEGVFIPLSLSDEALAELNVTVTHEEEPLEVIKQRKITELKYQRDKAEVTPLPIMGIALTMMTRRWTESMQLLLRWNCKAKELQ